MSQAAPAIEHAELATLQQLAIDGGLDGEVKVSCSRLADRLGVSTQTASRRLQTLDKQGYIERDLVPDGQWVDLTTAGRTRLRSEYEVYRRLFESKTSVPLRGSVTAGMGEGRHYISLPGYHRQFVDRLGYEPFPGTLNLTLTDESVRRRATIETLEPIDIDGWEDENRTYGPAACYPVTVTTADGTEYESAHAIIPERTHHDDDNLELIAPDKLRDVLDLQDEDILDITLTGADR